MECLFCGSTRLEIADYPRKTTFNNKCFSYLRCIECSLVFIDPLPDSEDYKLMYSANYHESFYFNDSDYKPDYIKNFIKNSIGNGKFLDYGCGDGSVLQYVRSLGLQCEGTEFDPELVQKLNNIYPNFKIFQVNEFWNLDNQLYNFIHLGDVLEHMEEPFPFLKRLAAKLEPNHGRIIIRGPLENNKSFALYIRKLISSIVSKSTTRVATHIPYHISFSNAENQLALFTRAELTTVHFSVEETNWPYPYNNSGTLGDRTKYLIAKLSGKLSSKYGNNWGNRFLYVGKSSSQ